MLIKTGKTRQIKYANSTGTLHKCICSYCNKPCWRRITKSIRSCGCMYAESRVKNKTIHGMFGTKLYERWSNMKTRCVNPNNKYYRYYSSKGIKVCPAWQDFITFAEWAYTNEYEDDLFITRIDDDGPYCPENCEWITRSENTRRSSLKRRSKT